MKNFKINLFLVLILLGTALLFVRPTRAAGPCYCERIDKTDAECRFAGVLSDCVSDNTFKCDLKADAAACDAAYRQFKANLQNTPAGQNPASVNGQGVGISKIIPRCAVEKNLNLKSECGDITIFLILMFNVIRYLFSIIGGVALLYFVYGGFILILSQGNSEKVAQGKGVIVAAVLGIIIAFSGYVLIRFVGDVAGITSEYRLNE